MSSITKNRIKCTIVILLIYWDNLWLHFREQKLQQCSVLWQRYTLGSLILLHNKIRSDDKNLTSVSKVM